MTPFVKLLGLCCFTIGGGTSNYTLLSLLWPLCRNHIKLGANCYFMVHAYPSMFKSDN